jgi:hypothetical protein
MDQEKLLLLHETVHNSKNALQLRMLSLSPQGLVSCEFRRKAWPLILSSSSTSWRISKFDDNKDVGIIRCDVDRSIFGSDLADSFSDSEREARREELFEVINTVIKKNPDLHYVQGFNYIISVFLLTAGFDSSFGLSEKCGQNYIRDYLRKDFRDGVIPYLMLVYKILDRVDPEVSERLKLVYTFDEELNVPNVILPWIICWFSSNFYKFQDICRIFDFCLATHPLAPLYLAASVILEKREEVLAVEDMAEVHSALRNVDYLDVDMLCEKSFDMMMVVPPLELASRNCDQFKSDSSVLRDNGFDLILKRKRMEKKMRYLVFGVIFTTSFLLMIK